MVVNEIINDDCLSVLKKLPSQSIDFVLTDPPYLVNYHSRDNRTIRNDVDDAWLKPVSSEIYRVLKQDSFFVSFYGWQAADKFLGAWREAGFRPVGHLVWTKRYASSERYLRHCHEEAFLLAKGNPYKPSTLIPDTLPWEYTGNILHPTEKPVSGLLPVILAFSRPGHVVLDPFAGSGSTLLAAKILGRNYLGVEIDSDYYRTAARRLQN